MNRAVIIFSQVVLGIAGLALLGFVGKEHSKQVCSSLDISLINEEEHTFVTLEEVASVINAGGNVKGRDISSLNITSLEKRVASMPEVKDAEAYVDLRGTLHITALQRTPIVRIHAVSGDSYYLDEDGFFMPLSDHYTARVPVATGSIRISYPVGTSLGHIKAILANDSLSRVSVVDDVFLLAKFLDANPFWRAQAEQIHVNKDRELELIPKVGDHVIILGDAHDLEEKFDRLMAMYQSGFPAVGWDKYSIINLKFENQVVCTRK